LAGGRLLAAGYDLGAASLRCKTLNNFSKACYSLPCLPSSNPPPRFALNFLAALSPLSLAEPLLPYSSSHILLLTAHRPLTCPVLSGSPLPIALSPLAATLMDFLASVANKRLTVQLSPLDATLTKNTGEDGRSRPRRNVSTRVSDLSSFLSHYCALFCSHPELNSFVFRRFRTLWQKHPGWGYIFTPKDSPPHLLLAAYFGLPPRPAWHPPSTVLSYRGHYATLSPRPFFPSLPPYLLASILAACSCHSARKPAHHPLRAQSRSCAGLQAYRPRRQTGHSCRFPRQSHPSEFLGHLVRTLPRRNSRPRRAPEQIQGPTPDSRPRGGR